MLISAGLCVIGGAIAFATISRSVPITPHVLPGLHQPCQTPPPSPPEPASGASAGPGFR
jgi:hypothetical protein